MTDQITQLLRELRPPDAERVDEIFPAASRGATLEAIFDGARASGARPSPGATRRARRERNPRRLWSHSSARRHPLLLSMVGGAGALAIALVVFLSGSAAVHPASAVAFEPSPSGGIVAKVTHPFAAQKRLDAAFAARGFHITIQLVPVSPSLVGQVIALSSDGPGSTIETLQSGTCLSLISGVGCPIGVNIPASFTGSASIVIGRPAQPKETYASSSSSFGPGELLHCSGLLNNTVAAAVPVLAADKLSVIWNVQEHGLAVNVETPPSSGYVADALPIAPGQMRIFVHPAPAAPGTDVAAYDGRLNRGCPASRTGETAQPSDGSTSGSVSSPAGSTGR
jgi:hypothetical protein